MMFQAPRPISHAPIHSHFTPTHLPFHQSHSTNTTHTTSTHHTVAVPLATHHKPIAISTHRGSGSNGHSGPNSATPSGSTTNSSSNNNRSLNPFAGRIHQTDPTIAYSPSQSPGISLSASASPAIHMSHAGNLSGGFSLSTPSPPPSSVVSINPTHELMFAPSSPLMSPHEGRRDSIDETEAASAHLQGILWRNAQLQLKNVSNVKHVHPNHHTFLHAQATPIKPSILISPVNMAGGALAGAFSASHNTPSTPTQSGLNSPSAAPHGSSLSRAIPIAKNRNSFNNNSQASILQQLQHSHSERDEHLSTSREGSRRGSASMLGSSPHTVGSFVLSHTPPVRANNPLENDQCFSPAQQAEYLMRAGEGGVLPMMISSGYREQVFRFNAPASTHTTSLLHSPVRVSTLSQSLAQRHFNGSAAQNPLASKFGAPHLPQSTADAEANIIHPEEDTINYPPLSCTL